MTECLFRNEDKLEVALKEVEDKEANDRDQKRAASPRKRKDSFDYFDAVQLLGMYGWNGLLRNTTYSVLKSAL